MVISPDQDKLAQAKPGDRIRFDKVDVFFAQQLLEELEDRRREIRNSLGLNS